MLSIEILELDLKNKKATVKASLPARVMKRDPSHECSQAQICEATSKKLKEQNKEILNCDFLTKPRILSNKYPNSLRETVLEVELKLASKQKQDPPPPKRIKKNQSSSPKPASSSPPKSKSKVSSPPSKPPSSS